MTHIRSKFAGIALGLGLTLSAIALPSLAGAATDDVFTVQPAQNEGVAVYAMVELTDLEQIAGRDNLDAETIRFLEQNLWFLNSNAEYAAAELTDLERIAGRRNLDTETLKFLESNLWDYEFHAKYQGPVEPNIPQENPPGFWYSEVQ
jgi:hypothetical protein